MVFCYYSSTNTYNMSFKTSSYLVRSVVFHSESGSVGRRRNYYGLTYQLLQHDLDRVWVLSFTIKHEGLEWWSWKWVHCKVCKSNTLPRQTLKLLVSTITLSWVLVTKGSNIYASINWWKFLHPLHFCWHCHYHQLSIRTSCGWWVRPAFCFCVVLAYFSSYYNQQVQESMPTTGPQPFMLIQPCRNVKE